ncbi:MAG: hypothetical protein IKX59_08890 [Bacteroidales bacterium]|nr:hypothetical protein [Bacteroidales bacterium]
MTYKYDIKKVIESFPNDGLVFICGGQNKGKTTCLIELANELSTNDNVHVFSLEMNNVRFVSKLIECVCGIPSETIHGGKFTGEHWKLLDKHLSELIEKSIYVDDTPGLDIIDLKERVKSYENKRYVLIDYLQLIQSVRLNCRRDELMNITKELKQLSKETNTLIIVSFMLRDFLFTTDSAHGEVSIDGFLEHDIVNEADAVYFVNRINDIKKLK